MNVKDASLTKYQTHYCFLCVSSVLVVTLLMSLHLLPNNSFHKTYSLFKKIDKDNTCDLQEGVIS